MIVAACTWFEGFPDLRLKLRDLRESQDQQSFGHALAMIMLT